MSWNKRSTPFKESTKKKSLRECCMCCIEKEISCPIKDCKHWIEYEDDLNCTLIAIENNGRMTLREVAERLNVSFVRIKQIQDKGLKKLTKLKNKNILKSFE